MSVFSTVGKVWNELHFKFIRNLCAGRCSGSFCNSVKAATDIYHLFEIFAVCNECHDWIDVKLLASTTGT